MSEARTRGLRAGPSAIHYFEEACPDATPFGSKGLYHNKAEWIVDLTTKARRGWGPGLPCTKPCKPLAHVFPLRCTTLRFMQH